MKKKLLFIALALTFNVNANVAENKSAIDDSFATKLDPFEETRRLLLLELSSLDNTYATNLDILKTKRRLLSENKSVIDDDFKTKLYFLESIYPGVMKYSSESKERLFSEEYLDIFRHYETEKMSFEEKVAFLERKKATLSVEGLAAKLRLLEIKRRLFSEKKSVIDVDFEAKLALLKEKRRLLSENKSVIDDNYEAKLVLLEEKRRLLLLELSSLDNKESVLIKKIKEDSESDQEKRVNRHNKTYVMSKLRSIQEEYAKNKNEAFRSEEKLINYVSGQINSAILATKDHEFLSGGYRLALDEIIKWRPRYFDDDREFTNFTKFFKKIPEYSAVLAMRESLRPYAGDEIADKSGSRFMRDLGRDIRKWGKKNPEKKKLWTNEVGERLLASFSSSSFELVIDLGELDISLLEDYDETFFKDLNEEYKRIGINILYKIKQ
ncbi:hypothetical protein N9351_03175 [Candidatus Thioglobus sp.]|nr:hypothetical protein [Candidatus Thioglobus sp.]